MSSLYVVGTPIGNLQDITERALTVLRQVDLIACEDTRHTATLLQRYKIETRTVSYHQHSSLQKIDWLVQQLANGNDIALVTDAGTPGISDPGGILVEKVYEYNAGLPSHRQPIAIVSIPGPSSVMTALSVSGFPADNFLFLGFLPKKKGRQSLLRGLADMNTALGVETVAFFESAIRIERTLAGIAEAFDEKAARVTVCLCRELTKKFEEIWRGTLAQAMEKMKADQKGEFVVVLHIARK